MAEKVTLPREVAEAIESLKRKGYTNFGIVSCINEDRDEFRVVKDYFRKSNPNGKHPNELLVALANGYEIKHEYVSFEEAMKALKEGNKINLFHSTAGEFILHQGITIEDLAKVVPRMFVTNLMNPSVCKWTIGDSK